MAVSSLFAKITLPKKPAKWTHLMFRIAPGVLLGVEGLFPSPSSLVSHLSTGICPALPNRPDGVRIGCASESLVKILVASAQGSIDRGFETVVRDCWLSMGK